MARLDDLLNLAAAAMEDGRDPFHEAFLIEHEVTLDEVFSLSEMLAVGARLLVRLRAEMREGGLVGNVATARLADALAGRVETATKDGG